MPCRQILVSGVGVLALLLVFVGVALNIGNGGVESEYSYGRSSVSQEHLSAGAEGGIDRLERPDSSQRRGLFGWGSGAGKAAAAAAAGERRARLAFLIMSSGNDIGKLELLLPEIYNPDNIYLVHVDAKAPKEQTEKIREVVEMNFPARDGRPPNGRMLEPAGIVSWGGFSITLACLYGIAAALLWDSGWDFFINLSASDFPIMTQDEMKLFLGEHADAGVTFLDGFRMTGFEKRWKGYAEDQGMQRAAKDHTTVAMKTLGWIERPYPQQFRLYKGEFWGVFHRSFCEYVSWSPDNVARTLSAYFTGYRISDESYFQTLACHSDGKDFPIHGDNFRFTSWNEDHKDEQGRKVNAKGEILIHPQPLAVVSVDKIKASGALFARKFDLEKSRKVYTAVQNDLRDWERSDSRLQLARARFRAKESKSHGGERRKNSDFCGNHRGFRGRRLVEEGGGREGDGSEGDLPP